MQRVVILGRGASGKSTLARRLGEISGLPVIQLDEIFLRPALVAIPHDECPANPNSQLPSEFKRGDLERFGLCVRTLLAKRLVAGETLKTVDRAVAREIWR